MQFNKTISWLKSAWNVFLLILFLIELVNSQNLPYELTSQSKWYMVDKGNLHPIIKRDNVKEEESESFFIREGRMDSKFSITSETLEIIKQNDPAQEYTIKFKIWRNETQCAKNFSIFGDTNTTIVDGVWNSIEKSFNGEQLKSFVIWINQGCDNSSIAIKDLSLTYSTQEITHELTCLNKQSSCFLDNIQQAFFFLPVNSLPRNENLQAGKLLYTNINGSFIYFSIENLTEAIRPESDLALKFNYFTSKGARISVRAGKEKNELIKLKSGSQDETFTHGIICIKSLLQLNKITKMWYSNLYLIAEIDNLNELVTIDLITDPIKDLFLEITHECPKIDYCSMEHHFEVSTESDKSVKFSNGNDYCRGKNSNETLAKCFSGKWKDYFFHCQCNEPLHYFDMSDQSCKPINPCILNPCNFTTEKCLPDPNEPNKRKCECKDNYYRENSICHQLKPKNSTIDQLKTLCDVDEIGYKTCQSKNAECVLNSADLNTFACECHLGKLFPNEKRTIEGELALNNSKTTCLDVCDFPTIHSSCSALGGVCNSMKLWRQIRERKLLKTIPSKDYCDCPLGIFYDQDIGGCVQKESLSMLNLTLEWSEELEREFEENMKQLNHLPFEEEEIIKESYNESLKRAVLANYELRRGVAAEKIAFLLKKHLLEEKVSILLNQYQLIEPLSGDFILRQEDMQIILIEEWIIDYKRQNYQLQVIFKPNQLILNSIIEPFNLEKECQPIPENKENCIIPYLSMVIQKGSKIKSEPFQPCKIPKICHGMAECQPVNGSSLFECVCNRENFELDTELTFRSNDPLVLLRDERCKCKKGFC